MGDRFGEGDFVRVKETGEIGRITQVCPAGTYWVVLSTRLFEAKYLHGELERA